MRGLGGLSDRGAEVQSVTVEILCECRRLAMDGGALSPLLISDLARPAVFPSGQRTGVQLRGSSEARSASAASRCWAAPVAAVARIAAKRGSRRVADCRAALKGAVSGPPVRFRRECHERYGRFRSRGGSGSRDWKFLRGQSILSERNQEISIAKPQT